MNFWKLFTILLGTHYTHTSAFVAQKALFSPWKQPWAAPFYLHDPFERLSFFNWLMKLKATVLPWKYFPSKNSILAFMISKEWPPPCHWAWPLTCSSHVRDVSLGLKWARVMESPNLPVCPLSPLAHFQREPYGLVVKLWTQQCTFGYERAQLESSGRSCNQWIDLYTWIYKYSECLCHNNVSRCTFWKSKCWTIYFSSIFFSTLLVHSKF